MTDIQGGPQQITGDTPHATADAGNPIKMGGKAATFAGSPDTVASGDRVDLVCAINGVLYTIGGAPNVLSREITVLDSDGPQTDTLIVEAGSQVIIVTKASAMVSSAVTNLSTNVRIGFGATVIPAPSLTPVAGIVLSHAGLESGSGEVEGTGSGILSAGAAGEDLRFTCDDPVGGIITINVTYMLVD